MTKSKDTGKKDALALFRLLSRHFDEGITIRRLAHESGYSERKIYRALSLFRQQGIDGLRRSKRKDTGNRRKINPETVKAIEGLILLPHKPPVMWVCRKIADSCREKGLPAPSYSVVLDIYHRLDQRLKTLAHDGDKAYEQEFDELIRREAEYPNEMWQCDHKDLKLWAINDSGRVGKVHITAILDDYSRVILGYFLEIGTPNSTRIATALRQAIWVKNEERWPVSGIPETFYSDHGKDFESTHIEQVAADLGMRLINTLVYQPKGRGKIERFFRTIVQMFSPDHQTTKEKPKPLAEIESAFRKWLDEYHHRKHSEIRMSPLAKWSGKPIVPRLPDSLDALDLLLMKVEKRKMFRDGIRLDHRRYSHELITESIGKPFDVRYDPRDHSHIWVYAESGNLICKAKFMGLHPSAEETQNKIARRRSVKKRLKKEIKETQAVGEEFIRKDSNEKPDQKSEPTQRIKRRLRKHFHERN